MFGPNITGRASWSAGTSGIIVNSDVVLELECSGTNGVDVFQREGDLALTFDASKASSIYSGATVQSPALQTLACIKF